MYNKKLITKENKNIFMNSYMFQNFFENACVAVYVKNKKILSMKVTDEHIHDSKPLSELVDDIIKLNSVTYIGKLFACGTYDGNDIFRYMPTDSGIIPCIKVRKDVKIKLKDSNFIRNLSVISQKNDLVG